MNVYCQENTVGPYPSGNIVGTYMKGGWVYCGHCHKRLYRIEATVSVEGDDDE